MDVSKNNGTPKSCILIGFSIINHPFWGTPIFGNIYIYVVYLMCLSPGYWCLTAPLLIIGDTGGFFWVVFFDELLTCSLILEKISSGTILETIHFETSATTLPRHTYVFFLLQQPTDVHCCSLSFLARPIQYHSNMSSKVSFESSLPMERLISNLIMWR